MKLPLSSFPYPLKAELDDLSKATDRLWQLDFNRLKPENDDYKINLQFGKIFGDRTDMAREPLFLYVKDEVLQKPTFASFIALLVSIRYNSPFLEFTCWKWLMGMM